MNRTLLTLAVLLFGYSQTFAQVPNLEWANSNGSTSVDVAETVITDDLGNVYITGYYNGTVDFDPGVGVSNLSSLGSYDIYVQKLDPLGNLLWVKSMGGPLLDRPYDIACSSSGDVYVTGVFE